MRFKLLFFLFSFIGFTSFSQITVTDVDVAGSGDDAINELSFSPYGSSKSGSYINYSGSRDITISAGTTNVYGDLDTKGKVILQSSPEFKTKANALI